MSLHASYHADSDADDEYERSVITSPRLNTDSETSSTHSEPHSAEPTPTTTLLGTDERRPLKKIITQWMANDTADFITSLGLRQYCDRFVENDIVGEALIALKHDELKEMGITSVGHRLTILKSVYEIKVKQDIPIDPDHYIPLTADQTANENATQEDVSRLIQSLKLRDERIVAVEAELRRVADDYRRLREELLPVFKMAKDRLQPLPPPDGHGYDGQPLPSPSQLNMLDRNPSVISRSFSKRVYTGNTTPKTSSPTHVPPTFSDGRLHNDGTLDPSSASSHLTALNGGSQISPGMPSPTSPGGHHNQQTLASRSYVQPNSANRNTYDHSDDMLGVQSRSDRSGQTSRSDLPSRLDSRAGNDPNQRVEIFKSFRVSMEDPCHKVLPAALKKYNIHGDWRQYALYIVHGDQERCLGLDERPLILFKQLEKEGRKPMFMLRKHMYSVDGSVYPNTGSMPNSATFDSTRTGQGQINLPGGVL